MKVVKVIAGGGRRREIEIPESYSEGYDMLCDAMRPYHSGRGGNMARMSAAAAVAYGLFIPDGKIIPADPTAALVYLMQRLCKAEGAGFDA